MSTMTAHDVNQPQTPGIAAHRHLLETRYMLHLIAYTIQARSAYTRSTCRFRCLSPPGPTASPCPATSPPPIASRVIWYFI